MCRFSFFPGTTGILYKQFSLTIAFSIAISAFNALTLSPALAALFLRAKRRAHTSWTFCTSVSCRALSQLLFMAWTRLQSWWGGYARVIHVALRLRYLFLVLFVAGLAATVYMYNHVPTAFRPGGRPGLLHVHRADASGRFAELHHGLRATRPPRSSAGRQGCLWDFLGDGLLASGGSSPNFGLIFAPLQPVGPAQEAEARGTRRRHCGQACAATVRRAGRHGVRCVEPPAIQGIGTVGGFQFILQDGGRNTFGDIDRVAHQMVGAAHDLGRAGEPESPALRRTIRSFWSPSTGRRRRRWACPMSQITAAMGTFMGSSYVNDFNFNNRSYRVYVQADQQFRRRRPICGSTMCAPTAGQMVPLDNLVALEQTPGRR